MEREILIVSLTLIKAYTDNPVAKMFRHTVPVEPFVGAYSTNPSQTGFYASMKDTIKGVNIE